MKKKVQELKKKYSTKDEIHTACKKKMNVILMDFLIDFIRRDEEFDIKKITLKDTEEFISNWVDLNFKGEI